MTLKKLIVPVLVIALLVAAVGPATAGKKKKKGPKPYTSEDGAIAVGHTLLFGSTGEVNSVTAKEFENRCAIPASNGADAYVYEVPEEYRAIQADFLATADSQVGHDLYAFFYDEACKRNPVSIAASGVAGEKVDAEGVMPAGTTYVLLSNFAGDPTTVHYELKP